MKIIAKLIFLGLLIICQPAYSQTNADKAKAAYFKSDENYQAANYQGCIDKLNEAIQLLGSSNARIQYLMAKSYKELGNYKQVKIELCKYFNYQPKEDEWYKEMLLLSDEADLKIKQNQEAEVLAMKQKQEADALSKKDDEVWTSASSLNTKASLENYISKFPSGKKVKEANNRLEKIYWEEAQKVNTLAAYDNFINKYPNSTYKNIAVQKKEPLLQDLKLQQNPDYYYKQELQKEDKADPYVIWKLLSYGVAKPFIDLENKMIMIGGYTRFYDYNALYIGTKLNSSDDVLKYLTLLFGKETDSYDKWTFMFSSYMSYYDEYGKRECKFRQTIMLYVDKFKEEENALLEIIKLFVINRYPVNSHNGLLLSQLTKDHATNKKSSKGVINNYAIIEYLLQNGADPKLKLNCYNKRLGVMEGWNSAYNEAKEAGKSDLIELFAKYKK